MKHLHFVGMVFIFPNPHKLDPLKHVAGCDYIDGKLALFICYLKIHSQRLYISCKREKETPLKSFDKGL